MNGRQNRLYELLRGLEGYTAESTWDNNAYRGGYGTEFAPGQTITKELAEQGMQQHADGALNRVTQRFPELSDDQAVALASLTYNVGPKWMQGSGLADLLDQGDYDAAANKMLEYNKERRSPDAELTVNDGLTNRRAKEYRMFTGSKHAPIMTGWDATVRREPTSAQAVGGGSKTDAILKALQGLSGAKSNTQFQAAPSYKTPNTSIGMTMPAQAQGGVTMMGGSPQYTDALLQKMRG